MKEMNVALVTLSPYERAVLSGRPKTGADRLVEEKGMQQIVKKMLGQQVVTQMEDGTEIVATPLEQMVAGAIQDAIERPSFEKIKTAMQVAGEVTNTQEVKVEISLVDQDLMKRALD